MVDIKDERESKSDPGYETSDVLCYGVRPSVPLSIR